MEGKAFAIWRFDPRYIEQDGYCALCVMWCCPVFPGVDQPGTLRPGIFANVGINELE